MGVSRGARTGLGLEGCPTPTAIVPTTELKPCGLTIGREAAALTSFSFTPSAALGDGDSLPVVYGSLGVDNEDL